MNDKLYPVVVYNNDTLILYIYAVYKYKNYLVEKKIISSDVSNEMNNDFRTKEFAKTINETIEKYENKIGRKFKQIYFAVEPQKYYTAHRNFSVDFRNEHLIEKSDLEKISTKAMKYEKAENGYVVVNFTTLTTKVNGQVVKEIIGKKARTLKVEGETVYIDEKTSNYIDNLINEVGRYVEDVIITNHLLRYALTLKKGEGILEVQADKVNVICNQEKGIKNFSIHFGMGHLFEKMYAKLTENYSPRLSEKVTRFIQEHNCVEEIAYDFALDEQITINQAIKLYNEMIKVYFGSIFQQTVRQGIRLEKLHLISYGYDSIQLASLFNKNLSLSIEELKLPSQSGINQEDIKVNYAFAHYIESKAR